MLAGCGSKYKDFCTSATQCEGGNDMDIDACVANYEAESDKASAYDCADPYTKVADCYTSTGTCKSKSYTVDCSDQLDVLYACEKAASSEGSNSGHTSTSTGTNTGTTGGGGKGGPNCDALKSCCLSLGGGSQCDAMATDYPDSECKQVLDQQHAQGQCN